MTSQAQEISCYYLLWRAAFCLESLLSVYYHGEIIPDKRPTPKELKEYADQYEARLREVKGLLSITSKILGKLDNKPKHAPHYLGELYRLFHTLKVVMVNDMRAKAEQIETKYPAYKNQPSEDPRREAMHQDCKTELDRTSKVAHTGWTDAARLARDTAQLVLLGLDARYRTTLPNYKPRVFLGSSTEAKAIAEEIHRRLAQYYDVQFWAEDQLFTPGMVPIEILEQCGHEADFAVLVLQLDDLLILREELYGTPRDNMVFEYAWFAALLGRKRVFGVGATYFQRVKSRICSDLAGVIQATYEPGKEDMLCEGLRTVIDRRLMEMRKELDEATVASPPLVSNFAAGSK
jgi:predicted nucleotide-binding protein